MFKNNNLDQVVVDNFLEAVSESNLNLVRAMLSCSRNKDRLVNSTGHGVSALSMAAGLGNEALCQLLLSSGANDFDQAYKIAEGKGHSEIAELIMKQNFKHAGEKMRNFEFCFKYGLFLFTLVTSVAIYMAKHHAGEDRRNDSPRIM